MTAAKSNGWPGRKLIKNQTEINGETTVDYKEYTWSATSLLCDRAYQIMNAKTYVLADSVLCLRSMRDEPIEAWKIKINWYLDNNHLKDLNRIDWQADGVRVENNPRIHNVELPGGDSKTNERPTV